METGFDRSGGFKPRETGNSLD
jgi:hypothetical protein